MKPDALRVLSVRSLSAEDAFQRFIWISFIVHVSIFFGITIKNLVLPSNTLILQNAVRVDVVALPDKLPEQAAPPEKTEPAPAPKPVAKAEPKPEPKPEPKKPDAVALKKNAKAQEQALNRLKQQAALDRLKNVAPSPAEPVKKKTLYAGNQVSQGDSVTGLEKIAFDEYLSLLRQRVNSNFTIPNWLANAPLKASVEIVLDDAGRITKLTLVKSSGNPTFDEAATNAVQSSAPFPQVPERLTRAWASFTIQFNFPDT